MLGGSGREVAEEVRVQQSSASAPPGPEHAGRVGRVPGLRCKRGLLSCAPCPAPSWLSLGQESTGCYPPGTCRLGSEGTLVFAGDLSVGVAPADCGPHTEVGAPAPAPGCHACHCTCVSPGQKPLSSAPHVGAGLSGNPHLQSWGGPRPHSTSVPRVLLIQ